MSLFFKQTDLMRLLSKAVNTSLILFHHSFPHKMGKTSPIINLSIQANSISIQLDVRIIHAPTPIYSFFRATETFVNKMIEKFNPALQY